jgi:3-oxoacyl-[acyl-carrier protein] reductase
MAGAFAGRRVVITGASKGIGKATAVAFAAAGADVAICARGPEALRTACAEIEAPGHKVHGARCDVRDPAALRRFIEESATVLCGIDVLVNNASAFGGADTDEDWLQLLQVDLLGASRASRAAQVHLARSGAGSIVHVSSTAAYRPYARLPAYGAIKAALNHYATSQAMLLAPQGIRVNVVAPGATEHAGGLWEARRESDPALYESTRSRIPFGRFGRPEDVAAAILFLASEAAGWITGQALVVDGGQSLSR